jgi:biopolymer transport protein ExbB
MTTISSVFALPDSKGLQLISTRLTLLAKLAASALFALGLLGNLANANAQTNAGTAAPSSVATPPVTAPAEAATTVAKPAPKVAAGENPYGLKAMIEHGDVVSKTVLVLLLIMSLCTWYVIATKLLEQGKLLKEAPLVREEGAFWAAGTLEQGAQALQNEGAFKYIADTAMKASNKHVGVLANVDLGTWMESSLSDAADEVEHRLQKGLSLLATVASTSPFIGLFGTVWGILNALTAIGVAGQASIDKVAGPVGEALIMTAIGLAVAVPAAMGYNWLVGRNTTALHYVNSFSAKLRAAVLGTTKST